MNDSYVPKAAAQVTLMSVYIGEIAWLNKVENINIPKGRTCKSPWLVKLARNAGFRCKYSFNLPCLDDDFPCWSVVCI